jgi:hypothetical protein
MSKSLDELRDELITKARYGKITPKQVEEKAKAAGLPPLECQPEFAAFDPLAESRWSIVLAIAWIAWRDMQLVAEQQPAFRSKCTHWVPRDWNQPVESGKRFAKRSGWFLEPWHPSTTLSLHLLDSYLRVERQLPSSACLSPQEAETKLWQALSEGRLKAEGFDKNGTVVEIPARDWTHLEVQESSQDVLKYDARDGEPAYTKVRLRRDDLLGLWPRQGGAAKSERDCLRWLVGLIRESPDERPKPKLQFQTEAQNKFKNLSERQFLRAWDAAVEEVIGNSWSKRGRPKTKSNHRTS